MTKGFFPTGQGFFLLRKCHCLPTCGRKNTSRAAFTYDRSHPPHSFPARVASFTPAKHAAPPARTTCAYISVAAPEQGAARVVTCAVDLRCPPPARDAPPPRQSARRFCRSACRSKAPRRHTPPRERRLHECPARCRSTPMRCRQGVRAGRRRRNTRGSSSVSRQPPLRPPTPLPPPPAPLPLTPPPLSPTLACGEGRRPRPAAGTAELWRSRKAAAAAVAAESFPGQGPRPWARPRLLLEGEEGRHRCSRSRPHTASVATLRAVYWRRLPLDAGAVRSGGRCLPTQCLVVVCTVVGCVNGCVCSPARRPVVIPSVRIYFYR